MAFGQQSGLPASARQVQDLMALLENAGHTDFRDARGPMGFSQRQAGGKFTRDEAEAFIDQLQTAEYEGESESESESETPTPAAPPERLTAADRKMRALRTDDLAAELQRRGWIVIEP